MIFDVLIVMVFSMQIYLLDMIPEAKRILKYFAKSKDQPGVFVKGNKIIGGNENKATTS